MAIAALVGALAALGCREKPGGHGEATASAPVVGASVAPGPAPIADAPARFAPPTFDAEAVKALAPGLNRFGTSVYGTLAAKPGNLVFSPASLSIALAMLRGGTAGGTRAELDQAFGITDPVDLERALSAQLNEWNRPQRGYELAVANRLFGERSLRFEPGFVARTGRTFAAPFETLDFAGNADGARRHINAWVAGSTQDRIRDLLPPLSITELTRVVLANAVYFNGAWQTEFDATKSSSLSFFVGGDQRAARPVRMMNATRQVAYASVAADAVQVLELPYSGEDLSMVFVLPHALQGLPALDRALDAVKLDRWTSALKKASVEISIPTFRIAPAAAFELKPQLLELGVRKVFGVCSAGGSDAPCPNFLPMAKGSFQVSGAYHKAFVEVNERGTEAAAATAIVVAVPTSSAGRKSITRFRADHPFLFFIRDRRTNLILFLGRVVDPGGEQAR